MPEFNEFKQTTRTDKTVDQVGWHDRVPMEVNRHGHAVPLAFRQRSESFLQWFERKGDQIAGFTLYGFLTGCGFLTLVFIAVMIYGLYAFFHWLAS